jgi:NAD(P)-dependent dehydrogenase (short-subunit alcohol dehydrogenase family)
MGTVLITGCSSGIGYELIEPLLQRGWTVIATLRNATAREELFSKLHALAAGRLIVRNLDITCSKNIEEVSDFIRTTLNGKLDCLINNAGYGVFGPLEITSSAQVQQQFEVNVIGVINLTRALLPFLRSSRGRVINISSILGLVGLPQSSLYCSSKFAVEGLSESLFHELKPHGVRVCIIEPGGFRTRFGYNINWAEDSQALQAAGKTYDLQATSYRNYLLRKLNRPGNSLTPLLRKIISAVESNSPPLRIRAGIDCHLGYLALRLLPLPIRLKITELGLRFILR